MADEVRKTVLYILNALDKEDNTLDRLLENVLREKTCFSKKDRALLQALVYGVLRWRGRLDGVIDYFSKTRLNKINSKVLNILRLGLFQIIYLDRIPVSAAVNTSVEMTKAVAAPWIVGYVNGLLRNAVREYGDVVFPEVGKDPVRALATKKSFPPWLIKRWLDRFGLKETGRLCDAINTIPPITVRCNTLKTNREKLVKALEGSAEKIGITKYAPDGVFFFNPKRSIPNIKAFKSGLFQVQDEAAQLVSLLLNPQPGETILDACAGLGGKTGHIAQLMKNSGRLVAMDKDENKLLRLESEMHRLGVSIVTPRIHDLSTPLNPEHFGKFDRILLDAPCSGLGVLRRNPDIKWRALRQNPAYYQKRQALFMDNLAHLVKPSGALVYAVCSTEPEENESVIKGFLNKHANFAIEKKSTGLSFDAGSLITGDGYLKTFPHLNNMDGFFSVCMKRKKVISRILKFSSLFFLFVLIVGASAYLTLTLIVKSEDTVVVPDLLGKNVVYVLELLTDLGLNTKVKGSEYSAEVPENNVIFQEPEPGAEIKKGRDVRIIISKGAKSILMPNLRGLSLRQAQIILEENSLRRGEISSTYSKIRKDEIIAQVPCQGTMITRGECVNLLVSMGIRPRAYKMPDLIGLTLNSAITMIESIDLVLGEIKTQFHKGKPLNTVVAQELLSGCCVTQGRAVNIVINRKFVKKGHNYLNESQGAGLFRYRLKDGFLKRHIRVRVNSFGLSVDLFDDFMKPGEEIWLLIPRKNDATVFLYEDGELLKTLVYDAG